MKHPIISTAVLATLSFGAACHRGSASTATIDIREDDIELCCDPGQVPGKIGDFDVFLNESYFRGFLDPASLETEIEYSGTAGTPARLSIPSTASLPFGQSTISIFLDGCDFTEVTISLKIAVRGVRNDSRASYGQESARSIKVRNLCPPAPVIPPQQIAETVIGMPIANFMQYTLATPTGLPRNNSNLSIPARIPDAKTETFQVGAIVVDLDQTQLENAFTGPNAAFPPGAGANGLTLVPELPRPMVPGRYLLTWQSVDADIPLMDAIQSLQYSFVADRDLGAGNNYVGQAPFLGDYWNDTDTQYSAEYTPATDWTFRTFRSITGALLPTQSGARCILLGQVNFFVLPWDEFDSTPEMDGRYTTFCHEGDHGQSGGPWSGDTTPPVAEPRIRLGWQVSL
ncbi:MAG: hypothetical protein KDC98_26360 [Planctomycetes bacterium]|nr:hypothetical protein [Planctomycetota bacterium]